MKNIIDLYEASILDIEGTIKDGDVVKAEYDIASEAISTIYDKLVKYKDCYTHTSKRYEKGVKFAAETNYEWNFESFKTPTGEIIGLEGLKYLTKFLGPKFKDKTSASISIELKRHTPEKEWVRGVIYVCPVPFSYSDESITINILSDEFKKYNSIRDVAKHIISKYFKDLDTFIDLIKLVK